MTPTAVIDELRRHGATISAVGGKLRIEAPAGAITPELRQALTANKPAIIAAIKAEARRGTLATAVRDARADGDRQRAADLLESFGERSAVRQYGGGQSRAQAEGEAASEALARVPHGWTAESWRLRLFQLAERCEAVNPDRAAELRRAAAQINQRGVT